MENNYNKNSSEFVSKSFFTMCSGIIYILVLAIYIFLNTANAQTVIYSTNFGTVANVNPPGWTFTGVNMNISTNNSSSGYTGASGSACLGEGNSVAFINTFGTSEPSSQIGSSDATLLISSMGYSTVVVSFGMRKSSGSYNSNATYSFEWSTDGVSYTPISYTEASASNWGLATGAGLTLPAGAGNQPTLYLRWSFVRTGTGSNFKIDDVVITGNNTASNTAPTIVMDITNTTNYLDGGITIAPTSPYITSGVISDPTDPAKTLGFNFTINDAQTTASNLTLTAVSSNNSVVSNSNIILTGSGASRNVKITPTSVGYTSVTITVTDGTLSAPYVLFYGSSAAASTPSNTIWHTGMSDASDAVAIDDNYYITGDDEIDVLNVYSRSASGLPLVSFDYTNLLGLDLTKPEVDLEAGTTSPSMINKKYWLGSMSTGGSSFTIRPNRDRLFATTISGTGAATTFSLNGYYSNLRARLVSWGDANGYNFTASAAAGVDSKSISGFAAEGMVFGPDNTTLYIGLRAPLVPTANRTKAVIAPIINFETWFNNGSPSGNPTFGAPIELNLGGRGFRDLIRLTNGTYIIVAGNAAGSPITSAIYKWTGNAVDVPILVPTSADGILNLEGVMELNVSGQLSMNQLQVLSDGGTDDLYNDGNAAKDLTDLNLRKFRVDNLTSIDLCFPTTPAISTVSNTLCSGQSTTLTASGANTYTWTSGPNTASYTVSPLTSTTYSVVGSDAYGCSGSALVNITVNQTPTVTASASNTLICAGNVINITATGANSYTWTGGSHSATYTASPITNTTYSVFGTSTNGCVGSSAISVTVNATPTVTANASNTLICSGDIINLTTGGANTYTWTGGSNSTTYSASPSANTTYSVIGTDINGCVGSAATTVSVNATPSISIATSNTEICSGNSALLTANGASTYTWSTGSNNTTYSVSPSANTTYSITGTDINGCIGNAALSITVNPTPTITASASSVTICSGTTTTLTAIGASTYTWSGGPNTSVYSISPNSNTTYTVTGTDLNNCSNTSVISISVNVTPTVSVLTNTNTICVGETATLTASGASTYTWQPSGSISTNELIMPNVNTTYSLIGSDNGCIGSSSIMITVNQLPSVSANTSNTLMCVGENAILTASSTATSYTWSNGATTMSTSVSPTATAIYTITVNDGFCSASASITQSVSLCTALKEIESNNNSLIIYPNPFTNSFDIKWYGFSNNNETAIIVYNTLGEIIFSENAAGNDININTKDWKNGAYYVKVNNKVSKIIKQE